MQPKWIKPLFYIAAVYDGLLGLVFLAAPTVVFDLYEVPPPNHMAYVQFPALLLIVFAVLFYRVAMFPARNRELILYGCGLKASYVGLAFGYQLTGGIPSMWVPWAWADLVFLLLFVWAWKELGKAALQEGSQN